MLYCFKLNNIYDYNDRSLIDNNKKGKDLHTNMHFKVINIIIPNDIKDISNYFTLTLSLSSLKVSTKNDQYYLNNKEIRNTDDILSASLESTDICVKDYLSGEVFSKDSFDSYTKISNILKKLNFNMYDHQSYYFITIITILICLFAITVINIIIKLREAISSQEISYNPDDTIAKIVFYVEYLGLNIYESIFLANIILLNNRLNHNTTSYIYFGVMLCLKFIFLIIYLTYLSPISMLLNNNLYMVVWFIILSFVFLGSIAELKDSDLVFVDDVPVIHFIVNMIFNHYSRSFSIYKKELKCFCESIGSNSCFIGLLSFSIMIKYYLLNEGSISFLVDFCLLGLLYYFCLKFIFKIISNFATVLLLSYDMILELKTNIKEITHTYYYYFPMCRFSL